MRRDDVEQRQLVVPQRLVDLVLQPQPGQPQQRRLPEREHRAPQLRRPLVVVDLAGGRAVALAGSARRPAAAPAEIVLRRTSVGCAVTTGQTSAPASSRATTSASRSAASIASNAAARLPFCGGEPSRRWNRRRRSWWMSSARLASSEKWLNARMTWLADRMSSPAEPLGQLLAVDLGAADLERLDAGGLDQVEHVVPGLLADHLAQDAAQHAGCPRAAARRPRGPSDRRSRRGGGGRRRRRWLRTRGRVSRPV